MKTTGLGCADTFRMIEFEQTVVSYLNSSLCNLCVLCVAVVKNSSRKTTTETQRILIRTLPKQTYAWPGTIKPNQGHPPAIEGAVTTHRSFWYGKRGTTGHSPGFPQDWNAVRIVTEQYVEAEQLLDEHLSRDPFSRRQFFSGRN